MGLEEEIQDERRRILVVGRIKPGQSYEEWVDQLANHLVRNRLTIEQGATYELVEALKAAEQRICELTARLYPMKEECLLQLTFDEKYDKVLAALVRTEHKE